MSDVTLKELETLRQAEKIACEQSLSQFVKSAWHIIEKSTSLIWNWHLDTICGYLMAFHNNELPDKRLIINIPPGTLKSILVAVMYPAWTWIHNGDTRYLSITNEQGLAIRDALRMKDIVTSEWYQSKWGNNLRRAQNEKTLFVNEQGGFRQSQGITASNTGKRGDCLLIDDPIDAKKSYSDVIRSGVNDTWDRSLSSRLNDLEKSGVLLIMQRVHEDDLAGHLLKKVNSHWTVLSIPMEYEGTPSFDAGKDIGRPELNDPRTKKGELLFPAKFSAKSVKSLKEDLGTHGTSAQLQQRPVPEGGGIIKTHYWRKWASDESLPVCQWVFHSYDTAFSEKDSKTAAYSACTRWGIFWHPQRKRYCIMLLGRWADKVGYPELRQKMIDLDKKFKPDLNLIEAKATGLSLIQDLKDAVQGTIKSYSPGKGEDKISRAHSITPIFEMGLVYTPSRDWVDEFIGIVSAFPHGQPPCADYCFIAGTMIATKRGNIRIENITDNDEVLTPMGFKKVLAHGCTGIRDVMNFKSLTGTKDHPIFTFDNGYVRLDTVTQASKLLEIKICSLIRIAFLGKLSLTEGYTEELPSIVNTICQKGKTGLISQRVYMLIFGDSIAAKKFLKTTKSTILMAIRLITIIQILNAYRVACIGQCLKELIQKRVPFTCKKSDRLQSSGIGQKQEENGTGIMQSQVLEQKKQNKHLLSQGLRSKALNYVFGAVQSLSTRISEIHSALQNAKFKKVDIEEVNTNLSIHTMQPVFNLSVEYPHCYFANGILVHNCDTVTQALIYLRKSRWFENTADENLQQDEIIDDD
jgi:predicted phage terminase large subunit-like protein